MPSFPFVNSVTKIDYLSLVTESGTSKWQEVLSKWDDAEIQKAPAHVFGLLYRYEDRYALPVGGNKIDPDSRF